jgi:hypothetical protein
MYNDGGQPTIHMPNNSTFIIGSGGGGGGGLTYFDEALSGTERHLRDTTVPTTYLGLDGTNNSFVLHVLTTLGIAMQYNVPGFEVNVGSSKRYVMNSTALIDDLGGGMSIGTGAKPWSGVVTGGAVGSRPTCDSTTRLMLWTVAATSGNGDIVQACLKGTGDTYAWKDIYTAP